MRLSKRFIAREWLVFLALLPLGGISCFLLGYQSRDFRQMYFSQSFYIEHRSPIFDPSTDNHWMAGYSPFDVFWNDAFGLLNLQTLFLWLLPFLLVTLLRSILWAIKILRGNDRQGEAS